MKAGTGAGGGPGALLVLLDGSAQAVPVLGGKFTATAGRSIPVGSFAEPWGDNGLRWIPIDEKPEPLTGINEGYPGSPVHVIDGGDFSNSAVRVQYVPGDGTATEDVDPIPDAPTALAATGQPGGVLLTWTPPAGVYDAVEVWAATVDDRAFAVKVAESKSDRAFHELGTNETRYYWIRARYFEDGTTRYSNWHPDNSPPTGVVGTAGAFVESFGLRDPSFDKSDAQATPTDQTYWTLFTTGAPAAADFIYQGGENLSNALQLKTTGVSQQAWAIAKDRLVFASGIIQLAVRYQVVTWVTGANKPSLYVGVRYYASLADAGTDTGTTEMLRFTSDPAVGQGYLSTGGAWSTIYPKFDFTARIDAGEALLVAPLVMVASAAGSPPNYAEIIFNSVQVHWVDGEGRSVLEVDAGKTPKDTSRSLQNLSRFTQPQLTDAGTALDDADAVGPTNVDPSGAGAWPIDQDLTLDNNLHFGPGAQLDVQAGRTLTARHLFAPPSYLFPGLGNVEFAVKTVVYPEWWGGGAAGLIKAVAAVKTVAAQGAVIILSESEYTFTSVTGGLVLDFDEDAGTGHQAIILQAVGGPRTRKVDQGSSPGLPDQGGVLLRADDSLDPDTHVLELRGVKRSNDQPSRATVILQDISIDGNRGGRGSYSEATSPPSNTGDCLHGNQVKDVFLRGACYLFSAPRDGLGGKTGSTVAGNNQLHIDYLETWDCGRDGGRTTVYGDTTILVWKSHSNVGWNINANGGHLHAYFFHPYLGEDGGLNIGGNGITQIAQVRANHMQSEGVVINSTGSDTNSPPDLVPAKVHIGSLFVKNNGQDTGLTDAQRAGLRIAGEQADVFIGAIISEDNQSPATQTHAIRKDHTGGSVVIGELHEDGNSAVSAVGGSGAVTFLDEAATSVGDDEPLDIGALPDMQLVHDTSVSPPRNLIKLHNGRLAIVKGDVAENIMVLWPDGAVTTFYDGSKITETKPGGLEVTGDLDATDQVRLQDHDSPPAWHAVLDITGSGNTQVGTVNYPTRIHAQTHDVGVWDGTSTVNVVLDKDGFTITADLEVTGTLGFQANPGLYNNVGLALADTSSPPNWRKAFYMTTGNEIWAGHSSHKLVLISSNTGDDVTVWDGATAQQVLHAGLFGTGAGEVAEGDHTHATTDADTLDGLDSTQFLRSDTGDVFTGRLDAEHTSGNTAIRLNNNVRIQAKSSTGDNRDILYMTTGNELWLGHTSHQLVLRSSNTGDDVTVWDGATAQQVLHAGLFGTGAGEVAEGDHTHSPGDAATLDGLDSTDLLRSNATDVFTGRLDAQHASGNTAIRLNNNVRIQAKSSGGSNRDILYMTTGDELWLGHTSHDLILRSSNSGDDVKVWDGAAAQKVLHAGDFGTGAGEVAEGDHLHAGVYEPADSDILKRNVAANITGQLEWQDGILQVFGNSADASRQYDGSNNRLLDTIQNSAEYRVLNAAGDILLRLISNGAAYLYYNNIQSLRTDPDGIILRNGPTLKADSGVPTASDPNGSIYIRTNGGDDTTIYIRESGAWVALNVTGQVD